LPAISMFYGLIVYMYFLDNKKHSAPHIHIKYQEEEAVIGIPAGNLLEGQLPAGKLRLVLAWIELHGDELMADWHLASTGQTPYKIDPLR